MLSPRAKEPPPAATDSGYNSCQWTIEAAWSVYVRLTPRILMLSRASPMCNINGKTDSRMSKETANAPISNHL